MNVRVRRAGALAAAWLLAAAVLLAADVRVTPLIADGQVYASFASAASYSDDARESVQSGLQTSLAYTVELRQPSLFWFDRTLASVTVTATVKFDPLTGAYQVSKLANGQVFWSDRTDKEDEARRWATTFDRVLLSGGEPLEPNSDYYVRVRMRLSPRRTFFLWPWGRDDAAGRADFTYIR